MNYPYSPQDQPQPYYPAPQTQQAPYYPPQQPQPPQGYWPQVPGFRGPVPHQPELARGTVDDFFGQPAASGKSISFNGKPPGTRYTGIIPRTLTNADIQQQTDIQRRPLFHPDGRPKFVMIIPLQLQPTAEFPDGRAAWYVKGNDKTELERAMEAAGCPPGTVPEAGAVLDILYTGDRPIPNLNAQKMKTVTYTRPAARAQQPATGTEPAPYQQSAAAAAGPAAASHPPFVPPYQQPAAVTQQPATPSQNGPVADLTDDQKALLARLQGGQ